MVILGKEVYYLRIPGLEIDSPEIVDKIIIDLEILDLVEPYDTLPGILTLNTGIPGLAIHNTEILDLEILSISISHFRG